MARDPIEKKPLYHFRPGSEILSLGFAGCNLNCPFCQNWHISQKDDVQGRLFSPGEIIAAALNSPGQPAIAYTYSEPLVHIEFILDCMKEARKAGVANVLVSNGCINSEAAVELLELCDAANIDLKCFSEETYSNVLGGDLSTVLNFIRAAVEKKIWLELTTLVVPGLNDTPYELDKCRDFIAELESKGRIIPWHLSAYHPAWKWQAPATNDSFLTAAARRAREKLLFVYSGNSAPEDKNFNDTICPHCGKTLISRSGFSVDISGLLQQTRNGNPVYLCAYCNKSAPVFG